MNLSTNTASTCNFATIVMSDVYRILLSELALSWQRSFANHSLLPSYFQIAFLHMTKGQDGNNLSREYFETEIICRGNNIKRRRLWLGSNYWISLPASCSKNIIMLDIKYICSHYESLCYVIIKYIVLYFRKRSVFLL